MARNLGPVEYSEEDTYSAYEATDTPSPGGSTSLEGLTDVDISNPSDGQTLVYDAATEKWVNGNSGGVTLLDGEYAIDSESNTVTLDITAGALMSANLAGPVLVRYTAVEPEYPDEEVTIINTLVSAVKLSLEGEDDTYTFTLAGPRGSFSVSESVTASEPVVFYEER